MLDIECYSFLNRALEDEMAPVVRQYSIKNVIFEQGLILSRIISTPRVQTNLKLIMHLGHNGN